MADPNGEDGLLSFVQDVIGEGCLRVEDDLGDGFVRLNTSEAQRRQAAHDIRSTEDIVVELLRNARDAHASVVFLAVTREDRKRRLVVIDDGDGVPSHLHERIFEPRVTSKLDTMRFDKWGVHGRGMALYSVSVNARTARVMASEPGKGMSMLVETDLDRLPEKTDQSTFPTFELTEAGTVSVRGPRNILRTACEFAIDSGSTCTLYLGSATDVAATLYAHGLSSLTASMRAFCTDSALLPVPNRLSVAPDPAALAQEASVLGLDISQRSARRIMDGQIAPLAPLVDRVRIAGLPSGETASRGHVSVNRSPQLPEAPGVKIRPDDLALFTARVSSAFSDLADAYYLQDDVQVEVKTTRSTLQVTIPIVPQP